MNDEPDADFKPLDPGRIQADDPVEMRYWSRELGCSDDALQQAVASVGPHVAAVRQHLASQAG